MNDYRAKAEVAPEDYGYIRLAEEILKGFVGEYRTVCSKAALTEADRIAKEIRLDEMEKEASGWFYSGITMGIPFVSILRKFRRKEGGGKR